MVRLALQTLLTANRAIQKREGLEYWYAQRCGDEAPRAGESGRGALSV